VHVVLTFFHIMIYCFFKIELNFCQFIYTINSRTLLQFRFFQFLKFLMKLTTLLTKLFHIQILCSLTTTIHVKLSCDFIAICNLQSMIETSSKVKIMSRERPSPPLIGKYQISRRNQNFKKRVNLKNHQLHQ